MNSCNEKWLEDSERYSFFPTYVWKFQLESRIHHQLNPKIKKILAQMHNDQPDPKYGGSWQSAPVLHKREELSELVACFTQAAHKVIRFLNIGYEDLVITGCWANVNGTGALHRLHSHPNNYLSGVYYVQIQPGADRINFLDPRIQTGIIRPPVTKLSAGNTDQVVVQVSNGMLLLFPAYLQHSVDPNQSQALRISLSFNMMFQKFTENVSKPLW